MELHHQIFYRFKNIKNKKVHIGGCDLEFFYPRVLCGCKPNKKICCSVGYENLGIEYLGNNICEECLTLFKDGKRGWTPNSGAGRGGRCIGGYGGRITNER